MTDIPLVVKRKQLIRPVDLPNGLGKSNRVVGIDFSNDKSGYALALERGWNVIFEQLPQRRIQRFVILHLDTPSLELQGMSFLKIMLENKLDLDPVFHIREEEWEVGMVRGVKLFATKVESATADVLARINKENTA